MNIRRNGLMVSSLLCVFFMACSKKQEIISKPILFITLKDPAGQSIPGATVRLYKDSLDSVITQISDSGGLVKFYNLEEELYYWLAEKGCQTNRNSQKTLNRRLIEGVVLYGYSVMSETGTLKITNTSSEPYNVSDSLFNVTITNDTTSIIYPPVGSHLIHIEKVSTPGTGKDTLIEVQCGDTSFITLPY